MRKYTIPLCLAMLLFSLPPAVCGQQGLDTLSLESIFHEPLLAGHRPDFMTFSPGLQHIYFQANDSSRKDEELFRVRLNGNRTEPAPKEFVSEFRVAPDNRYLAYIDDGDLWVSDTDFNGKRRLIKTATPESDPTWSPGGRRVAFIREGDLWIASVDSSHLVQVTEKKEKDPEYHIVDWAGSDRLVLTQSDESHFRKYYFPEYVHQYVRPGGDARGVARKIISVAYLDSGKVQPLFEGREYVNTDVSASGRYVALDKVDAPMKHRSISVYDLQTLRQTVVFRDSTDGWIYNRSMAFAPEQDLLMYQSERDGWNHIYTVHPDGSGMKQRTRGSYDIPWAAWSGDREIVYASNETDPGERHLYSLELEGDRTKKLTDRTGYRRDFHISRNRRYVVYSYTYFNVPFELYLLDLKNPSKEVRLTHTIPERFRQVEWQKEDYIRYTARDGKTELSMSVLEPVDKRPGEQYPVVVFVHGAGSLQNVYKGWSYHYWREYMFHQFLTARGYYVMEVDYRHSTGYGRAFREDVTNWMGKYETRDIVDGIRYLAGHYEQADTSRVGIYGGSYGGFMALYATSTAPDYFDAAAALRAVTNWENYYYTNPWYTWPRLGTPETDSTHYARSSPVTYVEQLQHPVLILHGLMDDNVGFQDAAQYIERLIQADGKEFELMIYPTERHSFQDSDAWYDEYRRIYRFFEEQLKP